jgi:hypothetical protein
MTNPIERKQIPFIFTISIMFKLFGMSSIVLAFVEFAPINAELTVNQK